VALLKCARVQVELSFVIALVRQVESGAKLRKLRPKEHGTNVSTGRMIFGRCTKATDEQFFRESYL
jgi:hypothetical protein